MNQTTAVWIAIAIGVALIAALVFLVVPEPANRAVIATERLDVAVLSMTNGSTWPGAGEVVRAKIETRLVNAAGINVFSRAQLDALLVEHALSVSGVIHPTTAIQIGSLTGVSKLVTGTVYGVETRSEETTVCVAWDGTNCTRTVPATRYTARIFGQVQVINAQTGRIERAVDVEGTDSVTVQAGNTFGGFDALISRSADGMASDVASIFTSDYTREFRYGLYRSVEAKGEGYVGKEETNRFRRGDEANLIVHFTRVRNDETFDLLWIGPDGSPVEHVEDVVSERDWRWYRLPLADLPPGRYAVRGLLNGLPAFEKPFTIAP